MTRESILLTAAAAGALNTASARRPLSRSGNASIPVWAAGVVTAGGLLYLIRYGRSPTDYHIFRGEPADLRSPWGIVQDALALRRRGLIQLGVLLLIATPVARVVFSVFAFAFQRGSILRNTPSRRMKW